MFEWELNNPAFLMSLSFFQIYDPGLPSCLAHDTFERVIQFDMMLYVKYFVRRH